MATYPDSMSVVAVVAIDGVYQTSGYLGAFVGDDIRGVTAEYHIPIPDVPGWDYGGITPFTFLVYGDEGDEITFTFQDSSNALFSVVPDPAQTITFLKDSDAGEYQFPLMLTGSITSPSPPAPSPVTEAACGESTELNPTTGQCEISCDGDRRRMAEARGNNLLPDVNDSVTAYLKKESDLTTQLVAAKTEGEMRELVRYHMEKFAKEDRQQLFGQPALA